MKKKTVRGKNHDVIRSFLAKHGPASAADIQKATKVKGNIYTTMQTLMEKKFVKKEGKLYSLDRRIPLFVDKVSLPRETAEKISNVVAQQPNPYANMLKREYDHIVQGIQQLQITANYISLRIKELERASQG